MTGATVGTTCPYCRFTTKPGAGVVVCPSCASVHHGECWSENRCCAVLGCTSAPLPARASRPASAPPPPVAATTRVKPGVRVGTAAAVLLLTLGGSAAVLAQRGAGDHGSRAVAADRHRPPSKPAASPTAQPRLEVIRFQTGVDAGQTVAAAYCRLTPAPARSSGVYCWTPNDGFTLALDRAGSRRRRADERANTGRVPRRYPLLRAGATRSAGGFSCSSDASGLRCVSRQGHGWSLPRYVGLPTLF